METRVAVLGIIVENTESTEELNSLLHDYGTLISSKSVEQANRLETWETVAVQVQKVSTGRIPSCSEKVSLCSIQAFYCLDEAHPHYGRQFALLKVDQFKC